MSIKDPLRKNLLDLNFQKYNSLLNTTIILVSTSVGILITSFIAILLSEKFDPLKSTVIVIFIGIIIVIIGYFLINNLNQKISDIKDELRNIRKESEKSTLK